MQFKLQAFKPRGLLDTLSDARAGPCATAFYSACRVLGVLLAEDDVAISYGSRGFRASVPDFGFPSQNRSSSVHLLTLRTASLLEP